MPEDKANLTAYTHRLESLVRLSRVLADSRLELDAKLQVCVDILAELAGAERASISLVEANALIVRAATNPRVLGLSSKLSERSISTDVVRSGNPVYFTDVANSEYAANRREGDQSTYRTPSLIVVPLVDAGTVAGTLNLSDKRGAPSFTPEDFELAREIAEQASGLIYFSAMHSRLTSTFQDLDQAVKDKERFGALVLSGVAEPLNQARDRLAQARGSASLADEEGRAGLARIQGELEMVQLRLANLSRVASLGDYEPSLGKVTLETVVQKVRENLGGLIQGARVKVWLEEDRPSPIKADRALVEAVLANLLSFVVAAASPEKGGRGEVTVRVTAHDQRALVQIDAAGPDAAFTTAKEAMNGTDPLDLEHDQMGLALVFSRRAALLLEGEISLLRLPGGGIRFVFSLPLNGPGLRSAGF